MKSSETKPLDFLSGEEEPNWMANRFSVNNSTNEHSEVVGSLNNRDNDSSTGSRRGPLIQVLNESENISLREKRERFQSKKEKDIEDKTVPDLEEDDSPPPLFDIHGTHQGNSNELESSEIFNGLESSDKSSLEEPPSLLETMMAEATKIQKEKERKKLQMERKRSSKASFGSGLKKGFLSNTSSSKNRKPKDKRKNQKEISEKNPQVISKNDKSEKDAIFELDKEGNLIEIDSYNPPPLESKQKHIPTLKPKNKGSSKDPLRLDEVQEAMMKDTNNYLQKNVQQWATEDLMEEKISKNPKLMAGFSNSSYTAALQEFQTNPKSSVVNEKMKRDIEFRNFIQEFMKVMGDHFIELGKKHDESKRTNSGNVDISPLNANRKHNMKEKDLGPFVEKTLKKIQTNTHEIGKTKDFSMLKDTKSTATTSRTAAKTIETKEQENQVKKIMQDQELTQILMDPNFQRIMQECSVPGKMQKYMYHPEHGRKLRKLIEAGLLRVA